ncbi:MAG: BrnT family toxin [Pseudomonadales bacterium]|nr:BrnT family toxin [Pseudomonadales bacterium]MBL4864865.1 BrnT family toxin [Pseudomonadales bacterium]
MRYEWDEEKDKENRRKHKLSLNAGIPVFDDPFRIEAYDGSEAYGEDRFITIGIDKELDTLYVCYTMRGSRNSTRLISVRRAQKHERQLYEQQKKW